MSGEGGGRPLRTDPRGLFVHALRGMGQAALPAAAALYGSGGALGGLLVVIPLAGAFIAGALGFSWLAWARRTYVTGAEDIRLEQGIVARSARSVPYERIQDVSLEQKLLPRLLGLAEVRFETGAGGKDEIALAYVSLAEGERLRELVRARKDGLASAETGETAPQADGRASRDAAETLFAMDERRILTFGLFEFSLVIFAVLMGAASQLDFLFPVDIWNRENFEWLVKGGQEQIAGVSRTAQFLALAGGLAGVILLGVVSGIARTFAREYGFRLERTPKGFRRRRGLFNKTDVVLPVHRVQAALVESRLIRRLLGWHSLKFVSLAQDTARSASHDAVPFGHLEEIWPVARAAGIGPPPQDIVWHRPMKARWMDMAGAAAAVLALAGAGASLAIGHPALPGLALLLAGWPLAAGYLAWRRHRHASDESQLYVRKGTLAPQLAIAPKLKLQSAEIVQGPLARRRGHATLHLGLAGGTLAIPGLPLAEAKALRRAIVEKIAAVDFSALPR